MSRELNIFCAGAGGLLFAGTVVWAPQFLTIFLALLAIAGILVLWQKSAGFEQVLAELSRARPVFALTLFGLLSAAWSISASATLFQSLQTVSVIVMAMVLFAASRSLGWRVAERLLACSVIAIGIAACLIVWEQNTGFMILRYFASIGPLEEYAFFNQSASILVVLVWLPLLSLRRLGAWKFFTISTLILGVVGWAVWLTASTTAQLALVVAGGCLILASFRPRIIAYLPAFVFCFVGFIGPFLLVDPSVRELIWSNIAAFNLSFQHRLIIWEFVASSIQERSILGWGLDTARFIPGGAADIGLMLQGEVPDAVNVFSGFNVLPLHPHNAALQIRLELGLTGLLLVTWLLVRCGNGIVSTLSRFDRAGALASMVAVTMLAMSSFGVWQTWFVCLCVSAAALSILAAKQSIASPAPVLQNILGESAGKALMISTDNLSVPSFSTTRILGLAGAFRDKGMVVKVFAESSGPDVEGINFKTFRSGQSSRRTAGKGSKVFSQGLGFARALPSLRREPYELVYVQASSSSLLLTILSRVFLRGPVVTEHGAWIADECSSLGASRPASWFQGALQVCEARASTHVQVLSLAVKRDFVEHGVAWDKISVVDHGTDTKLSNSLEKQEAGNYAQENYEWAEIAQNTLEASSTPQKRRRPLVAHVITGLHVGGAERMLSNYLTSEREGAVEHVVVALIGKGYFEQVIFRAGTPVFNADVGKSLGAVIVGLIKLRRILKALDPNVLDCWMYHGAVMGFACSYALPGKYARRVYFHIRCTVLDMSKYSRRLRFSYNACRMMARYVDRTIFNSYAGYEEHIADGFRDEHCAVIQNGISTDIFKLNPARREALRAQWGISPDCPTVCTVARYDPMKGYDLLLEAADQLVGTCHFVVAGLQTDSLLPERPNLTRLGARKDVPDVLSACDIYCLPSIFGEGFPNALAEGMSVGLTPVAFDVGDSRDIIGETGFVAETKDANALVAAIELAIATRGTQGDIKETPSRRRIIEKFSLLPVIRRFDALYNEGN